MAAQARWLGDDTKAPSTADAPAPPPPPAAATPDATSKRISARIERYAVNGGAPTYFVRAEQDGAERTLSVKFEQFRALHKKLQDDGGVLYGTADRFPKVTRKARLGLRMSPTEISEQCELLNGWLRPGQEKRAKFPTSKAPLSVVFHSFRLTFGRAIIARNGLDAWMCFPDRARAEHSR
jgi:hypothetical protein